MTRSTRWVVSAQEQAVAAWTNALNQLRIDTLLRDLRTEDLRLESALGALSTALQTIKTEIVDRNRGHERGMHGFIAEVAEVGIGNARSMLVGGEAVYEWVNDGSAVDLLRGGVAIQQKFYAAKGQFGLGAVQEHLSKYPDFVRNGGKYQLPSEYYRVIRELHDMPHEEASKLLSRSGDGPTLTNWKWVHEFFADGSVGIETLEPSMLSYGDVQRGAYENTFAAEEVALKDASHAAKHAAELRSKPSLRQGAQATLGAAAAEGVVAGALAVIAKRRSGVKLRDFTQDDWMSVGAAAGRGTVRGGIRGVSLYSLTNFTASSAAVASALVTAGFGIAEQAHQFRRGELSETEFIERAELVAVEAAWSALSATVGQTLIPVPILGAVVGNVVGMVLLQVGTDVLTQRELALVGRYVAEQQRLEEALAVAHVDLLAQLSESMTGFLSLLERAFDPDPRAALLGSIALARELGVASDLILDSDTKTVEYFTG